MMKYMASGLVPALFGLMSLPVMAEEASWSCRNSDFEISCVDGACASSEAFTPMSVHVSPSEFSLCAYTVCNEGPTTQYTVLGDLMIFGSDRLVSNYVGAEEGQFETAVVTLDTVSGAATIHWAGPFQTPAVCEL